MVGMLPRALKMGTGSEQYAPLARAIIGGMTTVIPAVFPGGGLFGGVPAVGSLFTTETRRKAKSKSEFTEMAEVTEARLTTGLANWVQY